MAHKNLLVTNGGKIEGKKEIFGLGGCGKSVVIVERRLGIEFILDSNELNYTWPLGSSGGNTFQRRCNLDMVGAELRMIWEISV